MFFFSVTNILKQSNSHSFTCQNTYLNPATGSANFFCKDPESKYFRLCRLDVVSVIDFFVLFRTLFKKERPSLARELTKQERLGPRVSLLLSNSTKGSYPYSPHTGLNPGHSSTELPCSPLLNFYLETESLQLPLQDSNLLLSCLRLLGCCNYRHVPPGLASVSFHVSILRQSWQKAPLTKDLESHLGSDCHYTSVSISK